MRALRSTPARGLRLIGVLAVLALLVAGCGSDDSPTVVDEGAGTTTTQAVQKGKVVIGSTNFNEQLIVANLYAGALEKAGYQVTVRGNLGAREIVEPALAKGEIDVMAEYVGTALEYLNKGAGEASSDLDASLAKLRERFAAKNITVLEPAPAVDANAIVVTQKTATEKSLEKISDLAAIDDELVFGGPPECPTRPLCLKGLQTTYGLSFKSFKPLDVGGPLTKAALEKGDIDVALLFSSDGAIAARGFVALDDDKRLQPAENVVPVVRTEIVDDDLTKTLNAVSAKLTTAELSKLNKQVDVDRKDPAEVAEAWLREQGLL